MESSIQEGMRMQDVRQFVCFKLASEEYAVPITDIQEVIRIQKITPIPQVPEFCLGVINLRGNVISVFDMRKKMRLEEKDFDECAKIIVASVDDEVFSMVVDEILENVKLKNSEIGPPPNVRMQIDKECIAGLGEIEGRMITLLDLRKVHQDIKKEMNG